MHKNKVVLSGSVNYEPKANKTKDGTDYCSFGIMSKQEKGGVIINATIFGEQARELIDSWEKGRVVEVEGTLADFKNKETNQRIHTIRAKSLKITDPEFDQKVDEAIRSSDFTQLRDHLGKAEKIITTDDIPF